MELSVEQANSTDDHNKLQDSELQYRTAQKDVIHYGRKCYNRVQYKYLQLSIEQGFEILYDLGNSSTVVDYE